MWESWKSHSTVYKNRVRFAVHANTDIKEHFVDRYYIDNQIKTAWCGASLVYAFQNSVREILAKYPNVRMIYLVSGLCVSVKPLSALFQRGKFKTTIWKANHPKTMLTRIQKLKLPVPARKLSYHSQWLCLTRKHAQIIANYDFTNLEQANRIINEQKTLKLCPDEYWIASALKLSEVNFSEDVIDNCLTESARSQNGDPSPITWSSLSERKKVWNGRNRVFRTLQDELESAAEDEDETVMFYRKVSSRVNLRGIFSFYP